MAIKNSIKNQQSDSEQYDSSIQRQLEDFDQINNDDDDDDVSDQQSDNDNNGQEEQDDNDGEQDKKKNKDQQQQQQKRDYYKQHLRPDQQVQQNPPLTVVVQGSKQSGKSSLIRSLVKHYTKYKIEQINGNITLRANKKSRITIIQCPNEICSMIDLAKIADVVILMIDASLGFQMETFQFLSLLKSHGFPNVMGALTHLDYFKENKQLRKTKKKFKKRFQYEVGGNYKLFNLGKFDNNLYEKIQTAKIARYLGNLKPIQIPWRSNHPFVLADRWQTYEDKSYAKDDDADISFYGYIRGSSYRVNGKIHIVGVGDYLIKSIQSINDPCPQYKKVQTNQQKKLQTKGDIEDNKQDSSQQDQQQKQKKPSTTPIKRKRRTLNQQQRIIYAPACNLGTMNLDHTSGYITIPKEYVKFTKMEDQNQEDLQQGIKIMRNMQSLTKSINHKLRQRQNQFQLFDGVKMQNNQLDQLNQNQNHQQDQIKRSFKKKKNQIHQLKKQTQNIQLINPYQLDQNNPHIKQDLATLIYESKQKMRTNDCSKYHPQGHYSQNLKSLFVTGMEQDVLKQLQEQNQDSQQSQKIKKQKNTKDTQQ